MIAVVIAALLGAILLVGYVMVLVGIRVKDRAMSLRHEPRGVSAALARRVTGCRVGRRAMWT